jgi:hypothetical protein
MTSPTIGLGRAARIIVNSVVVGYGKGFSVHVKAESDKDYSVDAAAPALLSSGNQTYTFTLKKLKVDGSMLTLLLAGTKFTVVATPTGSPPTASYTTLTNCIITDYNDDYPASGGILQDVSGEGISALPTDT